MSITNRSTLKKRLAALEAAANIDRAAACPCRAPWPIIDFSSLTDDELERLGLLYDVANLAEPANCPACGAATITQDLDRMTAEERAEFDALERRVSPQS